MKTAVFILNHNLPDYTDWLYHSIEPHGGKVYDTFIIDNGSTREGRSINTTFELPENIYFGGGFNAAMQYVLESSEYDSMLFLNNDLTVHGQSFVKTLREIAFTEDYDILSGCFLNIEPQPDKQCHWKTMWNWGRKEVRPVPFIDFQAPFIKKHCLETVGAIDSDLIYGWGIDALFAIMAKRNGWKMGVTDRVLMLHHNSLTVKRGVAGLTIQEYCRLAELGQAEYFIKSGMMEEYHKVRAEGTNYNVKL
jgi:GT2 family glycosyltransferase